MKKYGHLTFYPTVDGYKICNACEDNKPISEFKVKKDTGNPYNKCANCALTHRRAYEATEKYKENKRNSRKRNREKIRIRERARRARIRQESGSPQKQGAMSPERRTKCREVSRRRRAKKLGLPWEYYTEAQVIELYGDKCHICLEPISLDSERRPGYLDWERGLHIDHLIPISRGGSDTLKNVRPVHGGCNLSKGPRNPSKHGD
jgi:5-methylcytosine-specific restriction endonuclease McrA